ncbi:MAG: hypothetical protein ABR990_15590 [Terracidiphilus sp.]
MRSNLTAAIGMRAHLKPENLDTLKEMLTYHVVAGRITTNDLTRMIRDGGGKATLTSVEVGRWRFG